MAELPDRAIANRFLNILVCVCVCKQCLLPMLYAHSVVVCNHGAIHISSSDARTNIVGMMMKLFDSL